MQVLDTGIQDLKIVKPKMYEDDRGYFFESFSEEVFRRHGLPVAWVQDNQSASVYGVIRGLHYQLEPYAQTKLIRVLEGAIHDVAVDLRKNSPSFGQWFGLELSSENQLMLMIPKGFAHGFSVLTPRAVVFYKCDRLYAPESERGIIYNDKTLGIDWQIPLQDIKLSQKDSILPSFNGAEMNFK